MADPTYSYHTFIFPFIWQNDIGREKGHNFNAIKRIFNNNDAWGDDDLYDWQEVLLNERDIQPDGLNVNKLKYATYQYYQPAIREAVFGKKKKNDKYSSIFTSKTAASEKDIVQNFYFKPIKDENGHNKDAKYVIRKTIQVGKTVSKIMNYELLLQDIKLRLYNTGVGLLVFICENKKTSDLDDIKRINDYGRRITLPFVPDKGGIMGSVCADSITISWEGLSDFIEDNFREQALRLNDAEIFAKYTHVANFIKDILNYNSDIDGEAGTIFTASMTKGKKDKYWYIQPALDDRMFVMCAVNKNFQKLFRTGFSRFTPCEYINSLKDGSLGNYKNRVFSCESMEKSLYEFIYCDPPGGCTCYFSPMRQQLIKEHLYCRWVAPEFGTLYTVAAQAFNCVSDYYLILNYFRTEYYEMVCLVLAQRASLRVMQNEASSLSIDIEKDDNDVDQERRKQIANLQEKLIAFQNQINLYEISSQEQAIELYDMMRDAFLVNKHTSILQEQLDGLYNIANIHQSNNISKWAILVSVSAMLIAVPSFFGDSSVWPIDSLDNILMDVEKDNEVSWSHTMFITKMVALGIVVWLFFKFSKK